MCTHSHILLHRAQRLDSLSGARWIVSAVEPSRAQPGPNRHGLAMRAARPRERRAAGGRRPMGSRRARGRRRERSAQRSSESAAGGGAGFAAQKRRSVGRRADIAWSVSGTHRARARYARATSIG